MNADPTSVDDLLRQDIAGLVRLFETMLRDQAGEAAGDDLRGVQELAKRRRRERAAEEALGQHLAGRTHEQLTVLVRATTILFDLINLAEDRQRVRALRHRDRQAHPRPRAQSIAQGIASIEQMGWSAAQVAALLDRLNIELVITAHPTEAKRRSVRNKLRRLRRLLDALDNSDLLPAERERLTLDIRSQLVGLWQSDLLRPNRPTVLEEVQRGLFVLGELWDVIPGVYRDLREAFATAFPGQPLGPLRFLTFGSWIGGDRDGNPFVTAAVTAQTLRLLRRTALEYHLRECRHRLTSLSISERHARVNPGLLRAIDETLARWPAAHRPEHYVSPVEPYRRWLKIIEWRLEQALAAVGGGPIEGAYRGGEELVFDLTLMIDSMRGHAAQIVAESELEDWACQARAFGLRMARLDIRQESLYLRRVIAQIMRPAGLCEDYTSLPEAQRCALLGQTLKSPLSFQPADFSGETRDAIELFRLLVRTHSAWGPEPLGQFVISMTHEVSDVMAVVWLANHAARAEELDPAATAMPIAPLFETIDDLRGGGRILQAMLSDAVYARYLQALGNVQTIMVGYSDSTKDGGYLAANWSLYRAQAELHEVAQRHGVKLIIFHGRGGALGRGGGPAARGILSLPHHVVDGAIRITEQGEVLAERYDDPHIARRHLEQVTWATLLVSAAPDQPARPQWIAWMERLAAEAFDEYRRLVAHPAFIDYFVQSTPIEWIEQMPIASRPARRSGKRSLSDLRAIPWVFAWTQSRTMLPAWYGLGSAVERFTAREPAAVDALHEMYKQWPFFKATIDNAALALAKADMGIAHAYARLMEGPAREDLWRRLDGEYQRSCQAVLRISGQSSLLADIPWLEQSIAQRNPLVDPLNFVQVQLLSQVRKARSAGAAEDEAVNHLMRLTVQGIAAGMRTTG